MHEATFFGALATISSPKCCHYSGFQEHAVRSNSLNLSSMVHRDDGTYTQNVSTWQCLCLKLFVTTLKNRISKLARFSGTLTFIATSREKALFSFLCSGIPIAVSMYQSDDHGCFNCCRAVVNVVIDGKVTTVCRPVFDLVLNVEENAYYNKLQD